MIWALNLAAISTSDEKKSLVLRTRHTDGRLKKGNPAHGYSDALPAALYRIKEVFAVPKYSTIGTDCQQKNTKYSPSCP
ncbi:MAG: hypothetical protein ACI4PC_03920 [Oscillospiraceae bacterium]